MITQKFKFILLDRVETIIFPWNRKKIKDDVKL